MMTKAFFTWISGVTLLGSSVAMAEPDAFVPWKDGGNVVLFDAGRGEAEGLRIYTASWKKGGDLRPTATPVSEQGEAWIEFTFQGRQGMACSTFYFDKPPEPDAGLQYRGIQLVLDCDRDDYPHIGVTAAFSDNSQLTCDLTLEQGRQEYLVDRGFRRERHPPRWDLIRYVMLTLDKAASARTRRTTEIFAERYWGFTGQRLATATLESEAPETGIVLRLADGPQSHAGKASLPVQGYSLTVEPSRVLITAADEPGLYYGTVTFFQLLRHALKRPAPDIPVPCVEVRDWPDTPNRLVRLEHPHTFRNYAVRENRGIDYLIDWTDRLVAGNKFNTLYIDLSANVRYQRRPEFNGSEKIYSLDDLRRFGEFCRDHFIDLCPAWQIGGHANWWLTIGYHPELREKGCTSAASR